MSLLLSRIQGYRYHLSKFHIYALVYYIGVFFFFIYFCSDLYDFSPTIFVVVVVVVIVLLFPVVLGIKLGCLFYVFLVS